LKPDDKKFLGEMKEKAKSAAGTIFGDVNDLEHVLSFALMAQDMDRVKDENIEPEADRLRRILATVVLRCPDQNY